MIRLVVTADVDAAATERGVVPAGADVMVSGAGAGAAGAGSATAGAGPAVARAGTGATVCGAGLVPAVRDAAAPGRRRAAAPREDGDRET